MHIDESKINSSSEIVAGVEELIVSKDDDFVESIW